MQYGTHSPVTYDDLKTIECPEASIEGLNFSFIEGCSTSENNFLRT